MNHAAQAALATGTAAPDGPGGMGLRRGYVRVHSPVSTAGGQLVGAELASIRAHPGMGDPLLSTGQIFENKPARTASQALAITDLASCGAAPGWCPATQLVVSRVNGGNPIQGIPGSIYRPRCDWLTRRTGLVTKKTTQTPWALDHRCERTRVVHCRTGA